MPLSCWTRSFTERVFAEAGARQTLLRSRCPRAMVIILVDDVVARAVYAAEAGPHRGGPPAHGKEERMAKVVDFGDPKAGATVNVTPRTAERRHRQPRQGGAKGGASRIEKTGWFGLRHASSPAIS